MLSIFSEMI